MIDHMFFAFITVLHT